MSETSKNQKNSESHSCKKWCEDCQLSYLDGCPNHKSIQVLDRPVLPRAFSTLPRCLVISKVHEGLTTSTERSTECNKKKKRKRNNGKKVKENGGVIFTQDDDDDDDVSEISRFDECFNNKFEPSALGVFARKKISQRTQFGPVVSNVVENGQNVGSQTFHLLLDRNNTKCRLALSDVESCNWMMFVRPATSSTNQNLVAFQYDQSIFYISTKVIEEGQELRVWYARPYAIRMHLSILEDTPTEELGNSKVNGHDASCLYNHSETLTANFKESSTKFDPIKKEVGSNKRKRRLVEKKNDDDDDDEKFGEEEENIASDDDDDDDDYYHKKDKKMWNGLRKRKKQTRRRNLTSAPSKAKDISANVWCCQQCGISFDNPSLLRLHNFVHASSDQVLETARTSSSSSTDGLSKEPDQLQPSFSCPACNQEFESGASLTSHVDQHGFIGKSKPFKCQICLRAFANFERLQQHLLCHGDESLKPLACEVCSRRFMNPAALSVHMKTHGDRKYYTCPLCPESFDQIQQLRSHAEERHLERTIRVFEQNERDVGQDGEEAGKHDDATDGSCAGVAIATATTAIASGVWSGSVHDDDDDSCRKIAEMATDTELEFMSDVVGHCLFAEEVTTGEPCHGMTGGVGDKSADGGKGALKIQSGRAEGTYHCPECHRVFTEFSSVSRHVRLFHSSKSFECKECGRVFPRMDKLRLHSLRHSSHREFVCETCGRQFKRKDKLRDHVRRQHDAGKKMAKRNSVSSFTPEISPLDFMKFVFKCQKCLVGFKRRGMLVNHMAKKHPDVPMNSVPELNLPIVTSKHDFFCQYCNKVFKSNSKRKFHILKQHPGSEVPASLRPKKRPIDKSVTSKDNEVASFSRLDSSFSTPSGHLAIEPYSCSMCHRQYSSKSKLLQHQKKKHATSDNTSSLPSCNGSIHTELESASRTLQVVDIPIASSLPDVDYGDLFMGASIYFAPKSCMEGENDMAATGSVLVLSNEDDLLTHGASHLSFAKTQNFATPQAQINYAKAQQAVIIDPDVFAQAMNELTKSYAAKNSVLLTHFEAQHQFSQDVSHHDVISLNVDGGARFGSHQQDGGQCAIMSSPYISVVEYESLCSASSHTP